MRVDFSPPDISQAEIDAVVDTLKSGWITTGPKTKQFEKAIAAYCAVEGGVCLNSATAGMEMLLRLFGIGEGDEVITSAYTYSASAAVIEHVGAKIVLCDTLPDCFEINYDLLPDLINARTKAVIPVDIAGFVCDYPRILKIAEQKRPLFKTNPNNIFQTALGRILVMADAAHSFGSSRNAQKSGALADFSAFSFHAVKNLTTAEGGAVVWRSLPGVPNEEIYKQLMLLSLHGQSKDALAKINNPGAWEYDIKFPGYKCNMTDIMAALGLAQLARFSDLIKRREQIVRIYDSILLGHGLTILEHHGEGYESNMHLYLVRVDGADEKMRNRIISRLAEAGIAANVHFKPLPLMSAYKALGFDIRDYPNAYNQYKNEITLPLHTRISDEDAKFVAQTFLQIVEDERR